MEITWLDTFWINEYDPFSIRVALVEQVMPNPTVPANAISMSQLFRRAHAEAKANGRPRMTYRERFRSALRRAWRDAQMKVWEAKRRGGMPSAEPVVAPWVAAMIVQLEANVAAAALRPG